MKTEDIECFTYVSEIIIAKGKNWAGTKLRKEMYDPLWLNYVNCGPYWDGGPSPKSFTPSQNLAQSLARSHL